LYGWEETPVSCKFTLLLKKRQADTYCSQGLHKEALTIYKRLLATASNIDPDLKSFIQEKIHDIEADMADFSSRREGAITAKDINRLMQGASDNAEADDRLVFVQTLCSIGSYGDALAELKKLVHQDGFKAAYLDPLVDCLTNLYPPGYLPQAIDKFVSDCPSIKDPLSIQLSFAESLSRRSDAPGATQLYEHLLTKDNLTEKTTARITAAMEKLVSAPAAPPKPDSAAAESNPKDHFFFLRCGLTAIRTFLKSANNRCRSLLASMRMRASSHPPH
jgi:tetratricopeptide (TPR) repeat protein